MCVKIVRLKEENYYDSNRPLEEQIRGAKQIIVNYDPKDSTIDMFLDEIERLCKNGISANLNIKFNHNFLQIKSKKQLPIVKSEINEVVRKITTQQKNLDNSLEQLVKFCLGK